MPANPMTIGSLSKRSGVNIETIRYYERVGLIPPPPRSAGGYRLYGEPQLRRLAFVRRSRELGFTGQEIRALLTLVDDNHFTCAQVQTMTLTHLESVREKIRDLQRMESVLDRMAAQCDGAEAPRCPVIDALYEA